MTASCLVNSGRKHGLKIHLGFVSRIQMNWKEWHSTYSTICKCWLCKPTQLVLSRNTDQTSKRSLYPDLSTPSDSKLGLEITGNQMLRLQMLEADGCWSVWKCHADIIQELFLHSLLPSMAYGFFVWWVFFFLMGSVCHLPHDTRKLK